MSTVVLLLAACGGAENSSDGETAVPTEAADTNPDDGDASGGQVSDGSEPSEETPDAADDPGEEIPGSMSPLVEIPLAFSGDRFLLATEISPDGAQVALAFGGDLFAQPPPESVVEIYNAETGSMTGTVTLAEIPTVVDLNWWSGGLVAFIDGSQFVPIDVTSMTMGDRTSVSGAGCASSPDDELDATAGLLYSSPALSGPCRIDLSTGVASSAELDAIVYGVALNGDGSLLAVTTANDDSERTVSILDAATLEPTGETLDLPELSTGVLMYGGDAYVVGAFPPTIQPAGVELPGSLLLAGNPGAGLMVVSTANGGTETLSIVGFPDGTVRGVFTGDVLPENVSLAADGSRLLVTDVDADVAFVYEL